MAATRIFDRFRSLLDVDWASIADGNLLKRVGTMIVGVPAGTGTGDVVGPASSVDGELVAFDGTTGKLIKVATVVFVPPGVVTDFAGTVAPTGWLFCYGQIVTRTVFSDLFAAIGTTYGVGDGSTTFGLPDCRGRLAAGKDNMGGTSANRLAVAMNGDVLGGVGGLEQHTLVQGEMPAHAHAGPLHTHTVPAHQHPETAHQHLVPAHSHQYYLPRFNPGVGNLAAGPAYQFQLYPTDAGGSNAWTSSQSGGNTGITGPWTSGSAGNGATDTRGSGAAHNNLQPTIVFNKIIKT